MSTDDHNPLEDEQASPEARKAAEDIARSTFRDRAKKLSSTIQDRTKDAVDQASASKDKTLVVGLMVLCAVVALFVAWSLMQRQEPQPDPSVYTPTLDLPTSAYDELKAFSRKSATEIQLMREQLQATRELIDEQALRQNQTDQLIKNEVFTALQNLSQRNLEQAELIKQLESQPQEVVLQGPDHSDEIARILAAFKQSLLDVAVSPEEARARAALALNRLGLPQHEIDRLLAVASEEAGRIALADIAEPPLTDAEISMLPDWIQDLVPAVRDLVYGIALSEGRFYPEQVVQDVKRFIANRIEQDEFILTDGLVAKVATMARVRRENVTAAQEDLLPLLIALRDELGIRRNDRYAVAEFIWKLRTDRLPNDTSAGQMLSLAHVVGRMIGAADKGRASTFTPLDAETRRFAIARVARAIATAARLGKSASEQRTIAERALTAFLESARREATPEQRADILAEAFAIASGEKDSAGPLAIQLHQPEGIATANQPRNLLYFGPLVCGREEVQKALLLAVPLLLEALGEEEGSASWASAAITAYEQAPRLLDEHLPDYLDQPMGGRELFEAVLPPLLMYMKDAAPLGEQVPVELAGGQAHLEESRVGRLARGVAIGCAFGPWLHLDRAQGAPAASEAIEALQEARPLNETLFQSVEDTGLGGLITIYQRFRPGRFSMKSDRYQLLTAVLAGALTETRTLQGVLTDLIDAERAAFFTELARSYLPLAVATVDLPNLSQEEIAGITRTQLLHFAIMYSGEYLALQETRERIVPRYSASMGGAAEATTVLPRIYQAVTRVVVERAKALGPVSEQAQIPERTGRVVNESLPLIERAVVIETVLLRLQGRLRLHYDNPADLERAMSRARELAEEQVEPPYNPRTIDGWIAAILAEVLAGDSSGDGRPRGTGEGEVWPQVHMLQITATGRLVNSGSGSRLAREVLIPAGSYANAYLLSGADAEIGGGRPTPVLIQVELSFMGPNGSRIPLGSAHLLGQGEALAGPERLGISLDTLSYVLPSGRTVTAAVRGYIADNIEGQYGALGTWHWNLERVLPLAVATGAAEGVGDALQNMQTTQIVSSLGTVTDVTTDEDPLMNIAAGGLSGGFGILSDFFSQVLNDIRPSVAVSNGQRLTVVLLDPVPLDVSHSEFTSLLTTRSGFSP